MTRGPRLGAEQGDHSPLVGLVGRCGDRWFGVSFRRRR